MNQFFETKVRYEKTLENGKQKIVTETYLVDAMSFIEAETRITAEMGPYINGDFEVTEIKRFKASDYFFGNAEKYYKAKLIFISQNDLGEEKRSTVHILVQADSAKETNERIDLEMEKTTIDYEIHTVAETAILDVFMYEERRGE